MVFAAMVPPPAASAPVEMPQRLPGMLKPGDMTILAVTG